MRIPLAAHTPSMGILIHQVHLQIQERRRQLGLKSWSFTPTNTKKHTDLLRQKRGRK